MKKLFSGIVLMLLAFAAMSQECMVNINASASDIVCGSSVQLNAHYSYCWPLEVLPASSEMKRIEISSPGTIHVLKNWGTENHYFRKSNNIWQSFTIGQGNTYLNDVDFPSDNTGFIIGRVYGSSENKLFMTTNSGANWSDISTNLSSIDTLSLVTFVNQNTGFIASRNSLIKTSNGGLTWSVPMYIGNNIRSVYFINENIGFISCGNTMYKTTNGGVTWNQITNFTQWIQSIYFIDENIGFCVGYNLHKKTTDGGVTWFDFEVDNGSYNKILFLQDGMTGYLTAHNKLLKTIDGGVSWLPECYSIPYIYDIDFFDSENGYIVGNNAAFYPGTLTPEYVWTGSNLSNNSIKNPVANPSTIGGNSYTLTASAEYQNVCIAMDTFQIQVQPIVLELLDLTGLCEEQMQMIASTNYTGPPDNVTYQWSPETGLSDPNILNPMLTVSGNMTYTLESTTLNGCYVTESNYINTVPYQSHPICLVSVNGQNKNEIIWNDNEHADSYNIYKETSVTNQFNQIGTVSADLPATFVDEESNPSVNSNRYKISLVDECNLESEQSEPHKTMHLIIYEGVENVWFLMWEPYLGFEVQSYLIYRGLSPQSMELLASVPSSVTQYTDIGAPQGVYYQIEVVSPNPCSPGGRIRDYESSRSNIAADPITAIRGQSLKKPMVYPSPATDFINIELPEGKFERMQSVEIFTAEGLLIYQSKIDDRSSCKISVSHFLTGLYFLKIVTDGGMFGSRFFKE